MVPRRLFAFTFVSYLLLSLTPSANAQNLPVPAEQDSSKDIITRQVDRIVNDILNKIDRMMERYWSKGGEVEENDSLFERKSTLAYEDANYGVRMRGRKKRSITRYKPVRVSYPLHWSAPMTDLDPLLFRYNRVEGIFLGLGSPKEYFWDGGREFSAYGSFGYGFKTHRWQGNIGLDRWFFNRFRLEFGAEGHTVVDTKDEWFIGTGENTIAALFVRQDYHDYFRKDGFSVHVAQYLTEKARLRIDYVVDEYRSLSRNTSWGLFGGSTRFRENPAVDDGKMKSAIISFDCNTMKERRGVSTGWNFHASTEFAGGGLGGDFTFHRYLLEVRKAQPLSQYDKVNFRFRMGSSQGTLPLQKSFEIGGIGTLNAFSYKEFSGNRMILGNVEYLLSGSVLDDLSFWPGWLFGHTTFILFTDVGMTNNASPSTRFVDGFGSLNQWKSDIGVAIGSRDGTTRLAFAWRTDRKMAPKILLRIERPF